MRELGVGVIYNSALEPLWHDTDLVGVIEVEPQTLWRYVPDRNPPFEVDREAIERIRGLSQPKLVHGVGFPVGGSRPPDPRHLPVLIETIEALESPWASEHLGFNRFFEGGESYNTGFLLPALQTAAGARAAAESVRAVAGRLPVPFASETGVNYLQPRAGELSDGAFAAAVAEGSGCGILLDIHNLWANELNGRQPVREFVSEIPVERVWEVHIAGGEELDEYWLDAHSGGIPEPLLELAAEILPRLPNLGALIFEIGASFIGRIGPDGVARELEKLGRLWESCRAGPRAREGGEGAGLASRGGGPGMPEPDGDPGGPEAWERTLGSLVIGRAVETPLARSLEADPGVGLLRKLVWDFRAGMIADGLRMTTRLLLLHDGDEAVSRLLDEFFAERPPELFGSAEAIAFAEFLEPHHERVPYLREVASFERAAIEVLTRGEPQVVPFRYDPTELLGAITAGSLPQAVAEGNFEVEVTPDDGPGSTALRGALTST